MRIEDLLVADLKSKEKQATSRYKDFQQLYNLVKSQRNKFISMIQVRCLDIFPPSPFTKGESSRLKALCGSPLRNP